MRNKMKSLLLAGVLLLCSPGSALAVTVVVDAGHGGSDPGAIGINGLKEKQVNLDIASKLRDVLLQKGYEVVMTREDDRYISLADRVALTNQAKADLFVSVHANSHPSSAVNGTQVLYYDKDYPQADYPASDAMTLLTPESRKLAQSVLSSVVQEVGLANKGLVPSAVYVVRMGQVPSILVETAFLSNASDAAVLADDRMRAKFAAGIAAGIESYLPPNVLFPDLLRHWAREAVLRLQAKGIVEGEYNRFFPDRSITRAEFLAMLDRMFSFSKRLEAAKPADPGKPADPVKPADPGKPADQTKTPEQAKPAEPPKPAGTVQPPVFKDLPATHWASETMRKALALGYVDGYPDQTIRPDQPINRAEAAVLLLRVLQPSKPDKPYVPSDKFDDVPTGYWASNAIYELQRLGLINGVADRQYAPEKGMTRAEMAVLLDRYKPPVQP